MIPTADKWGRTHASKTHDKRHRSPQARKTKADGDNDEHGHADDHDEQTKHHDDDGDGDDDEMLILNNRSMRNRKMQQTIEAMVKILGEMRQR